MTEGTPRPELTRYVVSFEGRMFPSETGPWLYRDDVLATIDSLRSRLTEAERERDLAQNKVTGLVASWEREIAECDQLRAELAALRGKEKCVWEVRANRAVDCIGMARVASTKYCEHCGGKVELTNKEGV